MEQNKPMIWGASLRRQAVLAATLALLTAACTSSSVDLADPDTGPTPTTINVLTSLLDQPVEAFAPGVEVSLADNWPQNLPIPEGAELWQVLDLRDAADPRTVSLFVLRGRAPENIDAEYRAALSAAGITFTVVPIEPTTDGGFRTELITATAPAGTVRIGPTAPGTSFVVVLGQ